MAIGPAGAAGAPPGAAHRSGVPVACRVVGRVQDPDLERVERVGVLGGPLVGLAIEGEHLVRAGEADAPPVVLDALARDVDEAEAVPLDRLADGVPQVLLVVDGRLGVQARAATMRTRPWRLIGVFGLPIGLDSVFVPVGVVGPVWPPVRP